MDPLSAAGATASDQLLLASEFTTAFGADLRLRRLADRGTLHRVRRGVYLNDEVWQTLEPRERYLAVVRGAALVPRHENVLSHHSAAAIWNLPMLASWPHDVHFLTERRSGGRSEPGIRKHALGLDAADFTVRDGLWVTTIERTVVDLAAVLDLKSAVAVVDRALYAERFGRMPTLTTKAKLREVWERMLPFRGSVRAAAIIEFGTQLAGSPGESGSRVNIALNGFPRPELQHRFLVEGHQRETDFYWKQHDAIGESDGKGKYFDSRLRGGLTPAEVVYAEKLREDGLRRQVRHFTRWDFHTGMSQSRLRARLREMGLPQGRPWLSGE